MTAVEQTTRFTAQRVTAAIYGLVVTGAALAGAQEGETGREVALEVLAVVIAYWITEQYAEYLGQRLTTGHTDRGTILSDLRGSMTMIQATLVPLVVLLVAQLFDVSIRTAVTAALSATVLTLVVLVTYLSRASKMSTTASLVSGLVAAVFGVALIAVKYNVMH